MIPRSFSLFAFPFSRSAYFVLPNSTSVIGSIEIVP
jgi:hypothetical protein